MPQVAYAPSLTGDASATSHCSPLLPFLIPSASHSKTTSQTRGPRLRAWTVRLKRQHGGSKLTSQRESMKLKMSLAFGLVLATIVKTAQNLDKTNFEQSKFHMCSMFFDWWVFFLHRDDEKVIHLC